jgi:hypothetical protein
MTSRYISNGMGDLNGVILDSMALLLCYHPISTIDGFSELMRVKKVSKRRK